MIQKAVILFVIANICGYVVSQEVLQSNVSNALPDIQQDIIYVFENISTSTPEPAPAKQDLFLNADNETFIPTCVVKNRHGECTPYYLCANDSTILEYGSVNRLIITPKDNAACPLLRPCCHLKSKTPILPPAVKPHGCGFRNARGLGFEIRDEPDRQAQEAEFPWTVAILIDEITALIDNTTAFQCGGSLIHPKIVLTAAHCINPLYNQTMFIRAGDWDSSSTDEYYKHQDRQIEKVIIHEKYHLDWLHNDIALIILRDPVELNENVNTVCLPDFDEVPNKDRTCFAAGWGQLSWSETSLQAIMKKTKLPIVPSDVCQEELRTTRLGRRYKLHESFICAGGETGKDTCRGDGGSPLMCLIPDSDDQFVQYGIVSWGIGCGGGIPGVYTNLGNLRSWIDQKVLEQRLDKKMYLATVLDSRFGDSVDDAWKMEGVLTPRSGHLRSFGLLP